MLYNTTMLHLLRLASLWNLNISPTLAEAQLHREVPSHCVVSLPLPTLTTSSLVCHIARSINFHLLQWRLKSGLSYLPLVINAMERSRLG